MCSDIRSCLTRAPLSVEISRQDYWSRLPFHTPWDRPNPGVQLPSLASPALQADSLPLSHLGSPLRVSEGKTISVLFIIASSDPTKGLVHGRHAIYICRANESKIF